MSRPLRLSNAAMWVRCAFHPAMADYAEQAGLDADADNTVREDGTACHWAAAEILAHRVVPSGTIAPNGVELTEALLDHVDAYIEWLMGQDVAMWHVERELSAPTIGPNVTGHPDAFGWLRTGERLILPDFKAGYRYIDVWPNWQLIGYLAAIIDNYEVPEHLEVQFAIIQPRSYGNDTVRTHIIQASDAVPYILALNIAASAVSIGTPATSGPHCADCAGRHVCSAAHRAGGVGLEIAAEALIQELSPDALDIELQRTSAAIDMLTARHEALAAQARRILRSGGTLSHWMMGRSAGRLAYIDEAAEQAVIAMGDILGHNLRKPQQAITPTQAGKIIDTSLLTAYTTRRRGAETLAPVTASMIQKAFSTIKE